MNIIFFNRFHNGDLHVSREIVSKIISKVKSMDANINFFYSHCNDSCLLSDIDYLQYLPLSGIDQFSNLITINDNIYINTWYGQQNFKYMNEYGMTMDCLYKALDDTCKNLWKFSLADISTHFPDFFPTINYSKFEIEACKIWLSTHPEKKILVANGHAQSGQAVNFNMTSLIIQLAHKYPNKTFILTNKETNDYLPINVVYSTDIIKKPATSDLNENSFLSAHCDIIIGRSSGASTFAMTQENLFKRNIKVLYFTNIVPTPPNKFWADKIFRDRINFSADIINTSETNSNIIFDLIDYNISQ